MTSSALNFDKISSNCTVKLLRKAKSVHGMHRSRLQYL